MTSKKLKNPKLWVDWEILKVCWQPRLVLSQQTDDIRSNRQCTAQMCLALQCTVPTLVLVFATAAYKMKSTASNLLQCIWTAVHGCWSGGPSDKNEVEAQGLGVAHYNFHCWRPDVGFPQRWWWWRWWSWWWTQCAHYHLSLKAFCQPWPSPPCPAMLCYAVLGYRVCGHPTLLQHPKPWSVSCHPQDYMVSRAPNTKHRYVKKNSDTCMLYTNNQTIGKLRTTESLRTFCWLPKKFVKWKSGKNLNHYGTP